MDDAADFYARLIRGLSRPAAWPEGITAVRCIETHISTVLLTGAHAYKIKKPVDLGFLDFSTLARRKHFCEEEIRLNRRLAPQIYQAVVPVTGTPEEPRIGGDGPVIDYAVKMRQFAPEALLSGCPEEITMAQIERLARIVADFHGAVAVADPAQPYGEASAVFAPMEENFTQLRTLLDDAGELQRLDRLERWSRAQWQALHPLLAQRRREGFIRECHGDMHLGNIALVDGEPLIFDGIEFAPTLRWIDTFSEIAFLMMDLQRKGRADLAQRFLNSYLTATGDYAGLGLLRFYQLYRAMVRAKVDAIRRQQPDLAMPDRERLWAACQASLSQAERYTCATAPALLITHGLSGSGKSSAVRPLCDRLPAIWLRSDVERKRLGGLAAHETSGAALHRGIYHPQATEDTYGRLEKLAAQVIRAGFTAVVDATFLQHRHRQAFHRLARRLDVPFLLLDFQAPEALLRTRIAQRRAAGGDPSEADQQVLSAQLREREPLDEAEQASAICIAPEEAEDLVVRVMRRIAG